MRKTNKRRKKAWWSRVSEEELLKAYLKWSRSQTTGLKEEELTASVTSYETEEFSIKFTDLNADKEKIKLLKKQRRRRTLQKVLHKHDLH